MVRAVLLLPDSMPDPNYWVISAKSLDGEKPLSPAGRNQRVAFLRTKRRLPDLLSATDDLTIVGIAVGPHTTGKQVLKALALLKRELRTAGVRPFGTRRALLQRSLELWWLKYFGQRLRFRDLERALERLRRRLARSLRNGGARMQVLTWERFEQRLNDEKRDVRNQREARTLAQRFKEQVRAVAGDSGLADLIAQFEHEARKRGRPPTRLRIGNR